MDEGNLCLPRQVSIRAPAWGATMPPSPRTALYPGFNPRSRMGSDRQRRNSFPSPPRFNPRSRMGSDFIQSGTAAGEVGFNPRSRMGSDLESRRTNTAATTFQSALPHGERLPFPSLPFPSGVVSIRAPAWGATFFTGFRDPPCRVSIRAPAWGATIRVRNFLPLLDVSIRAPAWGATRLVLSLR